MKKLIYNVVDTGDKLEIEVKNLLIGPNNRGKFFIYKDHIKKYTKASDFDSFDDLP